MLVLLKNHLFKCFFKRIWLLSIFLIIFFTIYNDGKFKSWRKKIIKDIRNLFRLEKKTKAIKDIMPEDIKNDFEHEEEENYCKPVWVSNF